MDTMNLCIKALNYIQELGPSMSSDAIKTSELMFRVYTDDWSISPCPSFLSRMSAFELVATCSDFLGCPSSSEVVQYACSKLPVHGVATLQATNMGRASDDLGSEPRM